MPLSGPFNACITRISAAIPAAATPTVREFGSALGVPYAGAAAGTAEPAELDELVAGPFLFISQTTR